jgi:hypothetical protein
MTPAHDRITVKMPLAGTRCALVVIDVQPATLLSHGARETLDRCDFVATDRRE